MKKINFVKKDQEYDQIIKRYPKKRIHLNKNYMDIYNQHYLNNRSGSGLSNYLSKIMESWMHKKVSSIKGKNILELGAGNLNHIKYERDFHIYDIVEPFRELYKDSPELNKIRYKYKSLDEVKNKFDKIISIATLEHLEDLPKEINNCKKLLEKNGVFQVAVPCEGELAFKLGWKLTTGISFKLNYNLDYSKLIQYEHLNTLNEIKIILQNNFEILKFERSPFILPFKNLSFYAYFECKIN